MISCIRGHRWFLIVGLAYFSLGIAVGLYMNSEGIGATPDSVAYIASARSLVAGDGLAIPNGINDPTPMTHFGPLYPSVLALFGLIGLDVVVMAKFLSALFLGGILFIVAGLVYAATPKGSIAFTLAPLLIVASEDILEVHRYAFSEPSFFVLTTAGLFAFAIYLRKKTKKALIGAMGLLGLAALSRYAGLVAIPTIFVGAILLLKREGSNKRGAKGLMLSLLTTLPLALWFLRNWVRTGNPTNRGIAYHPIRVERLRAGLETISNWILPGRIVGTAREVITVIFVIVVLLVILYLLYSARKYRQGDTAKEGDFTLPATLGVYILSYVAMLFFTMSFIDAQLSLTPRPLSPIYLLGVISLLSVFPSSFHRRDRLKSGVTMVGILFLLSFNGVHAAKFISRAHAGSMMMYAGKGWQEAEIIRQVRGLPQGIPIYSNGEDAVYFTTERPSARLPQKSDPFTLEENRRYPSNLARMQRILEERGGVIVYFNGITWRWYLPSRQELEAAFPLLVEWIGEEGVIYRLQ